MPTRLLSTNLVTAWNTSRAQTVIDRWTTAHLKQVSAEVLAHISPAHFGTVNFRGTFRFSVERYPDRILGAAGRPKLGIIGGQA